MRIGIDARAKTGIGRYAKELITRIISQDRSNNYVLFLNSILYAEIDVAPYPHVKKVLVNATYYSFAEQLILPLQIERERVDLMHFLHFSIPLIYRKPSVVTIHDLTLSFFPGNKRGLRGFVSKKIYDIVIRTAARRAQRVIAVSEHTKQDLVTITGISPEKIHVIYEGCDRARFFPSTDQRELTEFRAKHKLPEHFLFYVGVWRAHKNVLGLIRAFHLLKTQRRLTHKLVIGGEEDPRYMEVKNLVRELGLEHEVIFPGFIPDNELRLYYASSDVFVFPSFYEGFGLPPLEALQSGTPVASSRASCMPEILGDAASYFDPSDITDMARVIENSLLDTKLRTKQLALVPQVLARYDWDRMAKETLALYTIRT